MDGMKIPIYQVDAFADRLFTGNPAAVCPLDAWLDDATLQSIAAENNLAETAFVLASDVGYKIRWFTPTVEVDLCGHATLASGHVLMHHLGVDSGRVEFHSHISGQLSVRADGNRYVLNFPADEASLAEPTKELLSAINANPVETRKGKTDWLMVFESQEQIESLEPDFRKLKHVDGRGVIVTAPGNDCDFVSRFFAPQSGIDEDPVTGSAHTTLTPYWSNRLNQCQLVARQVSQRGGTVFCHDLGERVELGGHAITYLIGEISI